MNINANETLQYLSNAGIINIGASCEISIADFP